ncbi:MAG: adenosylmethionine--8-amino-7-oxononanoate transaminase [Phycisphaerae bacterium]
MQNPIPTQTLADWDRQFLWHPFTPMKPWCENKEIVIIEKGDREFLFDTDGRRYIDAVSSLWCNVHGHNVPELNAAVTDQLHQIAHSTLLGLSNIPAITLAKRLVELTRSSGLTLDKVFYSDNGSTAAEVACKMAYQYWHNLGQPRTKFLALANAYHGDTVGAVSVGGIPLFHHAFKSLTFPVDFIAPHEGPAAIESLLQQNAYAAIIIEPMIQGAGGMIFHPPQFLRDLRRLADQYNTLLIFDEVMTGFGRTGKMFGAEHAAVTPDFLCLSKGLTAGYMPLGVTMTTQKIFNAFYVDPNLAENAAKTFFHGHTFTGHPLACAAANASLDLFKKNNTLAHVHALQPVLLDFLEHAKKSPYVRNPRHLGLIAAIDLAHPDGTPFPYHWRIGGALCTRMRPLGVMSRPLADTLIIMPPLAISEENLRTLCNVMLKSLDWIPEFVAQRQSL